jgi:hypothetical protein
MSDVENGSECSKLHQDAREQEHQKAGHSRIRRFACATLQTSCFDSGFHDRTLNFERSRAARGELLFAVDVRKSA